MTGESATPLAMLDTSALLDLPVALAEHLTEFASSQLCRAELEFGVALRRRRGQAGAAKRTEALLIVFDEARIWLPFDSAASSAYGLMAATAHAHAPAKARSTDAFIAAHAKAVELPVITCNVPDFKQFDVRVMSPSQAVALLNG